MPQSRIKVRDFIQDLLCGHNYVRFPILPRTLYVHVSIIEKWKRCNLFSNMKWEMSEEELQIGAKCFDMRLLIITQATESQLYCLQISIANSQFSFPWEDSPTLFIDAASFNFMMEFIKMHNLEDYILDIEEKLRLTALNDEMIKVVSFKHSVSSKLDIIKNYASYIKKYHKSKYYYVTYGLPWQQSIWVQKVHINDDAYSVLPIILNHLETFHYTNDLDIMDLLSLRLALNGVWRDLSQPNLLNCQIDYMITRELAKIVQNNHLDLDQYLIDNNITPLLILVDYLVYEFQNFFETLNTKPKVFTVFANSIYNMSDTIKLEEESDVLIKLKDKFNIKYCIDGSGFDQMSLPLFFDLIECPNVYEIFLDTNHRWLPIVSELNSFLSANKKNEINVCLKGQNTYNFVEDFVTAFKTITFANIVISLVIECTTKLDNYRIFDNLKISYLDFLNIEINTNLLDNFHQCDVKPIKKFKNCRLENLRHNWEILNNLEQIGIVSIQEDEGTWQSLFEFVLGEMIKSNSKEFQFNSKCHVIVLAVQHSILFRTIKFTVDEQNSKLEIRKKTINEIVDLFNLIFGVLPEEKSAFEFYD